MRMVIWKNVLKQIFVIRLQHIQTNNTVSCSARKLCNIPFSIVKVSPAKASCFLPLIEITALPLNTVHTSRWCRCFVSSKWMDCKGRLKTIIGSKMQRRLAYYYYVLSHRDKMVTAIKKISENKKYCNIHRGEILIILVFQKIHMHTLEQNTHNSHCLLPHNIP